MGVSGPRRGQLAAIRRASSRMFGSKLRLPPRPVPVALDDVEHQLQVLGCPRSSTAMYLFENARTAKSATD